MTRENPITTEHLIYTGLIFVGVLMYIFRPDLYVFTEKIRIGKSLIYLGIGLFILSRIVKSKKSSE